ncbi:MAG: zf-HC2 domain-containing protein [Actinomycetia bacterium]|nr:zf-HC2 domain-containing protein [Actinomycetes bacterium]
MVWNRLMRQLPASECARVGRQLQVYLDAEVTDPEVHERIREHLDACRECGLEAHTYEEIKNSLHSQGDPPAESVQRLRSFVDGLVRGDLEASEDGA